MELVERKRDRRSFLRQFGTALGVGIGAVALPSVALGGQHVQPDTSFFCCKNSSCPVDPSFSCTNALLYYCQCPTGSYCTCQTSDLGSCYNAPC
jgi:hypothetical protein